MEYIILDLEWDSVYFSPEKRFINQILQIGAVKLSEDFSVIDTFSATVCSKISKKVTSRFAKLTGITSEIMREGMPFEVAVAKYNEFAQSADVTMTWSNSDLYTIIENEELLLHNKLRFDMKGYLDLQKLVQSFLATKGYDNKNQIALESAAELLKVDTSSFELHTALDDSLVCAELLKLSFNKKKFDELLRDTQSPDFYKRLKFKAYTISNINDKQIEKSQLKFSCPECNGNTKRISSWKYRNRWFSGDFRCEKCGFKFNGRVMFKKTYDEIVVKHKVCEYKKRKTNNDMQSLPEKVPVSQN